MAPRREKMRLGDMLVKQELISEEQLMSALKLQKGSGKKIGEVLIEQGFITEEVILRALQLQLGLEIVSLAGIEIPRDVIRLVDGDILRKYMVVPFEIDAYQANILHLAMADPMDMNAMDDISIITNMQVEPFIASTTEIQTTLDRYFGATETLKAAKRYTREQEAFRETAVAAVAEVTEDDISDSPIVQLVRTLLEQAVRQRASDIHIESQENNIRVRFRIDGILHERMIYENSLLPAISTRIKIMGGMDISEKRKPQDGRLSVMVDRQNYEVRVSIMPTIYGEKIVLRISSALALTKSKEDLGLSGPDLDKFNWMLKRPYGIIFVTGPTGSGKSTTLYTALKELNQNEVNIVTVEDPVEASIPGINQVQVNPKADVTFANALRTILRQDPDIIMIGEIRDAETASIAVQASITGHLVLSTIHTNNAVTTLSRLAEMGVERYLVADSVIGVIAQRLVRRLCPHCRKKKMTTQKEMEFLGISNPVEIYEPGGCPICSDTGYLGRMGVFELLKVDDDLRQVIVKGGDTKNLKEAAREGGMKSLKDSGTECVLKGITSMEELIKISYEG
ncbi:MAG: GspE/PulE family protein [Lachnospiraceae bacterium]|nr:GspE/PulE family protein [Lachnospiraceae bacterium]